MIHEQNKMQHIEDIIFKFLEENATEEEQFWIQNWLTENEANPRKLAEYKVQYHWFKKGLQPGDFNKEHSWSRIKGGYYKTRYLSLKANQKQHTRRTFLRVLFPAAAAVFVAFVAGRLINSKPDGNQHLQDKLTFNEVYVPLGARSQITLSDGTKVWLNAGSRLRYPVNFLNNSRDVELEGEAYFDVKKMIDKIFIVKTSEVNIKVYGTQFNVKSYPDEDLIQTTLIEGSLAVEPIYGIERKNPIFLKPKQSLTYFKAKTQTSVSQESIKLTNKEDITHYNPAKIVIVPKIDPIPITSWKDNKWVIVREKLDDLAIKLERRYNVKITFKDESLKDYKFSGTLKEETFEQMLKIMQMSAPLLFTIEDNNVTFREDPSFRKKYDSMIKNSN